MVDVRPDVRWRGPDVGLPGNSPGLLIDTSRLVRGGLLGNLGTTLLGFDPRAVAARLFANSGNPFGFVDRQGSDTGSVPSMDDGLPSSGASEGRLADTSAGMVPLTLPPSPPYRPGSLPGTGSGIGPGAMLPPSHPRPAVSAEQQHPDPVSFRPTPNLRPSVGPRPVSDTIVDPNIVRVAGGEPAMAGDEVQIAQQQQLPQSPSAASADQQEMPRPPSPRPMVEKDPGEVVVLPDGSTISDPKSPTGKLMSPVQDLGIVAAKGRQTGATFRTMLENPETSSGALPYLLATLGLNLGQGGAHDHQRRGNMITGYTQLRRFRPVANVNVGLFGQQAGLTLEETLKIAGSYAFFRSSNANSAKPYGLDDTTREFIEAGYKIGASGMFDQPATP